MATEVVLDASALIALLGNERGSTFVQTRLAGAAMSTVNIAEVGDHTLRHGGTLAGLDQVLAELRLQLIEPDVGMAFDAAALFPPTRPAGLSLADRFCLALAMRLDRTALTCDRAWVKVAESLGARVELIR